MRTNIVIDDALLRQVMQASGVGRADLEKDRLS